MSACTVCETPLRGQGTRYCQRCRNAPCRECGAGIKYRCPRLLCTACKHAADGERTSRGGGATKRRKDMALDLEDLAHMTSRGDIDWETWRKVCNWRLVNSEQAESERRAYDRWKARLLRMGVKYTLVDSATGDLMPAGCRSTGGWTRGDGGPEDLRCHLRIDWPSVLRWTRRVLDVA